MDIHALLILALGLIAFAGGSWSGYRDGFEAGRAEVRA